MLTIRSMMQGGSWANDADNLRADIDNDNDADNRNDNLGFRLAAPANTPTMSAVQARA